MVIMRGKNYTLFVAGLVGFIGLACYPIIIEPMLNTDKYSKGLSVYAKTPYIHIMHFLLQRNNRKGIEQGSSRRTFNPET